MIFNMKNLQDMEKDELIKDMEILEVTQKKALDLETLREAI